MVSPWWLLWAFLGGGFSGILVMALMRMAPDPTESVVDTMESAERRSRAADAF
jgi:hypothetical protein